MEQINDNTELVTVGELIFKYEMEHETVIIHNGKIELKDVKMK